MSPSVQLNLPPREVKRISATTETHGKSLSVDLCELVVTAFTRCGYSGQQAAGMLDMKHSAFSKAFSHNYPDQNPAMKRLGAVPIEVIREFASLLAAQVGLSSGIDSAKVEASVRLAEAVTNLLRVANR